MTGKLRYLLLVLTVISVSAYLAAFQGPDTGGEAVPALSRAGSAVSSLVRNLASHEGKTSDSLRNRLEEGLSILLSSVNISSVLKSAYPESESLVGFDEARALPTGQVQETVEMDGRDTVHIAYVSEGEDTQIWVYGSRVFYKTASGGDWHQIPREQVGKAAASAGDGSLGYLLGSIGHEESLDDRELLKGASFNKTRGELAYKGYRYDLVQVSIPRWDEKIGQTIDGAKLIRYDAVLWLRKGRRPMIDRMQLDQVYEEDGRYTYWLTDGTYSIRKSKLEPPEEARRISPFQ